MGKTITFRAQPVDDFCTAAKYRRQAIRQRQSIKNLFLDNPREETAQARRFATILDAPISGTYQRRKS